jgi:hypothetical protein
MDLNEIGRVWSGFVQIRLRTNEGCCKICSGELYPGICLTTAEKARKSSIMVVEKCPDIPVAAVQHTCTRKQYTEQHSEVEYTERNIYNNTNTT